jgi:gliding motility-associated-like protein
MMVFNRWGELIFSTADPAEKWDGTYNGVVSQDGVYVYRVGYTLPYQKHKEVIGSVTLLR